MMKNMHVKIIYFIVLFCNLCIQCVQTIRQTIDNTLKLQMKIFVLILQIEILNSSLCHYSCCEVSQSMARSQFLFSKSCFKSFGTLPLKVKKMYQDLGANFVNTKSWDLYILQQFKMHITFDNRKQFLLAGHTRVEQNVHQSKGSAELAFTRFCVSFNFSRNLCDFHRL